MTFRLMLDTLQLRLGTPLHVDPRPLRAAYPPAWTGVEPGSYADSSSALRVREEILTRLGLPSTDAYRDQMCSLNGLETPEQKAAVRRACPDLVAHWGVAVSLPWEVPSAGEGEAETMPEGETRWRVRVIDYFVSPTDRGWFHIFDYHVARQPETGRWKIVGRTGVLHGG